MESQLTTEEQQVIVNGKRIASRQARNRFIQAVRCHGNSIEGWQKVCKLLRLCEGIITIEIKPLLELPICAGIGGLLIDGRIVTINGYRQGIIPLLICQDAAGFYMAVNPERSLDAGIGLAIDIKQSQALKHCSGQHNCNSAIWENSQRYLLEVPFLRFYPMQERQ